VFWFGTARVQNVAPTWPSGYAYTYALDTRAEGVDTPAALFGAVAGARTVQRYKLEVVARMRATVLASGTDGATVAFAFDTRRVHLESPDAQAAAYDAALERDLGMTYVERTDAAGRVIAFASDPHASPIGAGYVRALAGTLSVSKSPDERGFSRTWVASEPVADGVRSSSYELAPWLDTPLSVPTARFVRTARIASPPQTDAHAVAPVVFARSFDQGLLRTDGVLAHMLATESRGVRIGDRRIASSLSTVDATLIAIAPAAGRADRAQLEARVAAAGGLYLAPSSQALQAKAYRDAARKTTFAALLASLQAKPAGTGDVAQRTTAFAAQFFVRADAVAKAAPFLARARVGTRTFETLKLGLQNAGTPAAQALLARTMLARAADPASDALAEALARVAEPDANAIAALRILGTSDAHAETAALSLGTAASTLALTNPPLARAIVAQLRGELKRARSMRSRRVLLLALGNAGVATAYADIAAAAHDADSDIRAAATLALRAMPAPDADAELIRLLHDPQEIVRLDAAKALGARTLDRRDRDALSEAARSDPDRNVRAAAASKLHYDEAIRAAERL
jgi:hypothetical protein